MKIVLTPDWFIGKDVLIDLFSFIILLVFFILCYKNYRLNKNKKVMFLGWGFLAIAVAQLATILTKIVLYYDTTFTQQIGQMIITYHVVNSVDIFYYLGFFFNRILTLLGLFIIYKLHDKKWKMEDFFIGGYFIVLSAFMGAIANYVYHLSIVLFLCLIIANYCRLNKKNNNYNTKILIFAFTLLTIAHFVLILSKIDLFFVIGNLLELLSYITLLYLIIRIIKTK